MKTTLLTKTQRFQLLRHWQESDRVAVNALDFRPVVKWFTPDAQATFLLVALNPADEDTAFALCDLGLGHPELGYVRLSALRTVRGRLGLRIERDRSFCAEHSLREYWALAQTHRRIVT